MSILALGFFSVASGALAQSTIDWGAGAQNITGDSDVFTGGTLVHAYNLGDPDVLDATVNGVTFQAFAFPASPSATTVTVGNYTLTEDAGFLVSYNNLGSGAAPYSGLSTGYQSLLSSAGGGSFETTLTLTITGLTVGEQYVFQFFTSNSSLATSPLSGTRLSTTAFAGNSISLTDNVTNTAGGLGQFAIGTFTATDPTQVIEFNGVGSGSQVPTIDAFQLRVVPEPSSVVMMLVGVGGLGALMRFRRRLF